MVFNKEDGGILEPCQTSKVRILQKLLMGLSR